MSLNEHRAIFFIISGWTLTTVVAAGSTLDVGASGARYVDGLALAAVVGDVELDLLLLLQAAEALAARKPESTRTRRHRIVANVTVRGQKFEGICGGSRRKRGHVPPPSQNDCG